MDSSRNKCTACYRQYNKMEHLVEHMKVSFHSSHEPTCGVCMKHCRSFESLREHLIGPLPKAECAKVFSVRGCNLCLNIFDSQASLRHHRGSCQFSRPPGIHFKISRVMMNSGSSAESMSMYHLDFMRSRRGGGGSQAVGMRCKMVGGGNDGSLDLCARVCLVDEDENIIFHAYVKPQIPVTNYRCETTGISAEHMRNAMPLKIVQRKIHDFLCNGEAIWKIRAIGGKARILVGHGLDHDLERLGLDEYPAVLRRDIAKYPPLMKTSKLSNSLKYLTQAYLGYDIQTSGVQDPYEECVSVMRLYRRMSSGQRHRRSTSGGETHPTNRNTNSYVSWKQRDLEKMSPSALLSISASDYYCWCLDCNYSKV